MLSEIFSPKDSFRWYAVAKNQPLYNVLISFLPKAYDFVAHLKGEIFFPQVKKGENVLSKLIIPLAVATFFHFFLYSSFILLFISLKHCTQEEKFRYLNYTLKFLYVDIVLCQILPLGEEEKSVICDIFVQLAYFITHATIFFIQYPYIRCKQRLEMKQLNVER